MTGDMDNDGSVTTKDFLLLRKAIEAGTSYNANGVLDSEDLSMLRELV